MKNLFCISISLLLFLSCSKNEEEILPSKKPIITNTSARISISSGILTLNHTIKGIPFNNKTYKYNLYKSEGSGQPLVIALPGGGFKSTQLGFLKPSEQLNGVPFVGFQQLSDNNIAYLELEYYTISEGNYGIQGSLASIVGLVEEIRKKSDSLGIDKDNIILLGRSAGASSALWMGLQNQYDFIKGIVAIDTQSSLNIYNWINNFGTISPYSHQIASQYLFPNLFLSSQSQPINYLGNLYKEPGRSINNTRPNFVSQEYNLEFLNMMDENDPEIYIMNTASPNIKNESGIDFIDIIHHITHSYHILKIADNKHNTKIHIIRDPYYLNPNYEFLIQFFNRKFAGN